MQWFTSLKIFHLKNWADIFEPFHLQLSYLLLYHNACRHFRKHVYGAMAWIIYFSTSPHEPLAHKHACLYLLFVVLRGETRYGEVAFLLICSLAFVGRPWQVLKRACNIIYEGLISPLYSLTASYWRRQARLQPLLSTNTPICNRSSRWHWLNSIC